jgi:hypothetical protein
VEDFINIILKGYRCNCESKGQNQGLENVVPGLYCGFPYVFISNLKEPVGIPDIDIGDIFYLEQAC